jgi:hypothetical protein
MRLGEPVLPLLLYGQRFFVSRALGFGHTTAAAQCVAVAQTIAVTPLVDALASDREHPSQNAHVLSRPYPAQGLKLKVAIKSAWLVLKPVLLPRKENCHLFPCLTPGAHSRNGTCVSGRSKLNQRYSINRHVARCLRLSIFARVVAKSCSVRVLPKT